MPGQAVCPGERLVEQTRGGRQSRAADGAAPADSAIVNATADGGQTVRACTYCAQRRRHGG